MVWWISDASASSLTIIRKSSKFKHTHALYLKLPGIDDQNHKFRNPFTQLLYQQLTSIRQVTFRAIPRPY